MGVVVLRPTMQASENEPEFDILESGRSGGSTGREDVPVTEALLIRSYDHQSAYDVEVELIDEDGLALFRESHYLLPGHTHSVTDGIPPGEYRAIVTLDNELERDARCRIGPSPEHGLVIEVGNGALSLTEGLYG